MVRKKESVMKFKFNFAPLGKNNYVGVNATVPPCASSDGELRDNGNRPYAFNIKRLSEANEYRKIALWTGKYMQLAAMSIPSGELAENERHMDLDRMIIVTSGYGQIESSSPIGKAVRYSVSPGYAMIIPAGEMHTIRNTGGAPLRFYSVYTHPVLKYGESVK
jgi:mannose-6-phosphate isomerase-like protein (cupin superfamily)